MKSDLSLDLELRLVYNIELVTNKIKNLIQTYPGERLFSRSGVPMDDYLFTFGSDASKNSILAQIKSIFQVELPDVTINDRETIFERIEDNTYLLHLVCTANGTRVETTLTLG